MKNKHACTMADVAKQVGVSREVVSAVLHNGKYKGIGFSEDTARKVRAAVKALGYRPNGAARAMRRRESRHVGILMSGAHASPYEFPVIMGINEAFQAAGYSLSVIDASGIDPGKPEEALVFREQILAGIFIMHVPARLEEAASASAPRHLHLDSNVKERRNCVYRDEWESGRLVAERMAALGHRRILYVSNTPWKDCHSHMKDRQAGLLEMAASKGMEVEIFEIGLDASESVVRAPGFLGRLEKTPCVAAVDYGLAQWCANVAAGAGLCAGRDFSLASCSESLNCGGVWPWLSRVSFDRVEMGRKAAKMMLSLLRSGADVPSVVMKGEWIDGKTVRHCGGGGG